MKITEVTIEVVDPTGVNTAVGNHTEAPSIGDGDNKIIGQYQGNHRQFNTSNGSYNNNYYGNYQGRGGCGHGENYFRPHGHGRGTYQGHNNYQYHQYDMHDDGSQVEQYVPPCTLYSGFNHSPKHCFKGNMT